MPCIDYLSIGTNTDAQQAILNNDSSSELGNDTTEPSQSSDPDVPDCYPDLEALTEASSENVDVMTTPDGKELPLIPAKVCRGIGKAAILSAYINDVSAANEKGELFPKSWVTGQ